MPDFEGSLFTHQYPAYIINSLKNIRLSDLTPPITVVFGGGGVGISCFVTILSAHNPPWKFLGT
jgi:hypothetical protein